MSENNYGYKIIDTHTHTYPETIAAKATENLGHFYNFTVHSAGTHSDLENQAKECGYAGFFLFCVATNAHQVCKVNDSVAALCELSRAHGFIAEGFAGIHQDYDDFEAEVERCRKMGLHGVKLHPDIQGIDVNSPRLMPLYEILDKKSMKLYLHAGDPRPEYPFSQPRKIAEVAKAFPSLKITAAHFGGYGVWSEAEEYLYGLDNVWYDCSSALWAMSPEEAGRLTRKCGYDKMMFGTDYPILPLSEYLDLFMKIDLTESQRERIFFDNAMEFLGK